MRKWTCVSDLKEQGCCFGGVWKCHVCLETAIRHGEERSSIGVKPRDLKATLYWSRLQISPAYIEQQSGFRL